MDKFKRSMLVHPPPPPPPPPPEATLKRKDQRGVKVFGTKDFEIANARKRKKMAKSYGHRMWNTFPVRFSKVSEFINFLSVYALLVIAIRLTNRFVLT